MGRKPGVKNRTKEEKEADRLQAVKEKEIQKAEKKKQSEFKKLENEKKRTEFKAKKNIEMKSKIHKYTPLAETSLGSTELYYLYGIVIDAQTPHEKNGKFIQFIKLIDISMHNKKMEVDEF